MRKAGFKLNALARITPYINLNKKRLLSLNACFMSQFNYCQFVWLCHNRTKNRKINRLYERCLRLIYNDKKSSFEELLEIDSYISVHDRNLRALATEMYKVYHSISPTIMNGIFVRYLGSKIQEIIPTHAKELDIIDKFKIAIIKWKPEFGPCRLCKFYLQNIGYIQT